MAGPSSSKGKEIMHVEEDSKPKCMCKEEYIHANLIHRASETLIRCLQVRFQKSEPHIFQACSNILSQYASHEITRPEVIDRLTRIPVNEVDVLEEAAEVFAMYMSMEEWLTRQLNIHPMDGLTVVKILNFYGL